MERIESMGNTSVRRESDGAGIPESVANQLLENIDSHAVFMLDGDGAITAWPPPAAALYGYDAESILGEDVSVLFTDGDGTSAGEPPDGFLSEADGGTTEVEHWHERADGSVFWGTLTLSSLSGEAGFVAISQNETTTKEYERMLERQNDRLKEFTDILSHDLRSPLSVIDGRLQLYRETGEADHLEAIETTTDRMEALVEDLLRVARQGQVVEHPEPTDLDLVLDTAREGPLSASATVEYDPVPMVMADTDRLTQLLENLLRNSADHGDEAVTVRVGPLEAGFYVEDDGPGIPERDRERVFDHGYTTCKGGTGYGLSVVRSIVGAHGWDIVVTDAEDGGARFEISGIEFVNGS